MSVNNVDDSWEMTHRHIWPVECVFNCAVWLTLTSSAHLYSFCFDSVVVKEYTCRRRKLQGEWVTDSRGAGVTYIDRCKDKRRWRWKSGQSEWRVIMIRVKQESQLTLHAMRRNFSLLGTRPACSSLSRRTSLASSALWGIVGRKLNTRSGVNA